MNLSDVALAIGRSAREAARAEDTGSAFVRAQLMSAFSTARHLSAEVAIHEQAMREFAAALASLLRDAPVGALPAGAAAQLTSQLAAARDHAAVGALLCGALETIRASETPASRDLRSRIRSLLVGLVELEVAALADRIDGPRERRPGGTRPAAGAGDA